MMNNSGPIQETKVFVYIYSFLLSEFCDYYFSDCMDFVDVNSYCHLFQGFCTADFIRLFSRTSRLPYKFHKKFSWTEKSDDLLTSHVNSRRNTYPGHWSVCHVLYFDLFWFYVLHCIHVIYYWHFQAFYRRKEELFEEEINVVFAMSWQTSELKFVGPCSTTNEWIYRDTGATVLVGRGRIVYADEQVGVLVEV